LQNAKKALKGFRGKQEFSPNDFGGSTPPKSRELGEKESAFDCGGAVKRANSAKARRSCRARKANSAKSRKLQSN